MDDKNARALLRKKRNARGKELIDFRRGIQEDDLPGYADVLAKQQNLSSVEGAMHYQRARLCQRKPDWREVL